MNDIDKNNESGIVQQTTAFAAVNENLGGHQPGFELINEKRPDAIERFVVLNVRGTQHLSLPPAQKIMKAAKTSFSGGGSHGSMTAAVVKAASLAGAHLAVCDTSLNIFNRSLSIDKAAALVRQYLVARGQPTDNAHPLVLLALLEMVRRFQSAHKAGVYSDDLKFEPALNAGLQKWAA